MRRWLITLWKVVRLEGCQLIVLSPLLGDPGDEPFFLIVRVCFAIAFFDCPWWAGLAFVFWADVGS